ncbi:unnamed protein product [Tuber aestivum]|uniref:Uncharacterized protein n=1 Tax=Tuber aestivum TaxID=59557 RepID=A0A292Q7W3_9PEZI|nr:unnamed protein product [Tuber aestivum]
MADGSRITVESIGDITPGTIFIGYSTLPSYSQPKRRPFLALWKVGDGVVSFLRTVDGSVQEGAEKFGRSIASYYPIAPASNPPYLPIPALENFEGFIDLLTPVTLGQSSLGRKSRGSRISEGDLRCVIMAHVSLVQCGQEAVQTGKVEQESEMLLIDRRTHDGIRQMALDLLQRNREGLLQAGFTEKVTLSIIEAFDRPPAAKLILPRLHYPTPSRSTFVDPQPPSPLPPQRLEVYTQRGYPAQQSPAQKQERQPPQQPQQPQRLSGQHGLAGCRPSTPPGHHRNPDNGDDGNGSPGIRGPRDSNFYSGPTGSGNQGVKHKKESHQGEHQYKKDSNNEEDGIDEWANGDWARVEETVPEGEKKEKQLGEDSDSNSLFSQWGLDDRNKIGGVIPENTPTQTPTCESTNSLMKDDQHDDTSGVAQGNKQKNHHLRTRAMSMKIDPNNRGPIGTNTSATSSLPHFQPRRNGLNHNLRLLSTPYEELQHAESFNKKPSLSLQPVATAAKGQILRISILQTRTLAVPQPCYQSHTLHKPLLQQPPQRNSESLDPKLAPFQWLGRLSRRVRVGNRLRT